MAAPGGSAFAQAPIAVPPPPPPLIVPPPLPPPPIVQAPPLVVPPPDAPAPYVPFKNLPPVQLDEADNGIGIAQQTARAKGVQGRVLWIDGTANLNRVNTADKIAALTAQIKTAGFNTIVFDVKPIVGLTLYPSKYADKITTWVGGRTPAH